jgi:hypothetical protein
MIKVKNRDNLYFKGMDPWENALSARKLARLKKSWAEIFRQHILSRMPITRVATYFNKEMGRPSKELVSTCGACVLQQIFDLTDDETVDQMAFNQQWHYALDVLDQDDQVLSLKTLWNMRHILTTDSLAKEVFNDATDRLKEVYKVDTSLQRLDSVHIHSNMARLGRVRLLARVCRRFIINLKRHHKELYESVSSSIKDRYEKEQDSDYFGSPKPSESHKRLTDIAEDMYELIMQFKGAEAIHLLYSYQELQRVFSEHCMIEDETVVVKPNKEVPAESLQNPADPDATYDSHKGQGYQVQVMETYSKEASNDNEAQSLQLITYVDVEPAHCHDSNALAPALDETEKRGLIADELTADSHYGSRENKEKAKEHGVDLIAPVPGNKPKHNLVDFEFDPQTHEVQRCPEGHAPTRVKRNKKGTLTGIWSEDVCATCALFSSCAVKKAKHGYRLLYNHNEADAASRRRYERSAEFKDKYRYRAGIEATNSRYVQMTGARRMRYRGLKRIDNAARLKALGINMFRAAKYIASQVENPCYT